MFHLRKMLHDLLTGSIDIFSKEKAVVRVSGTQIMIVGDVHGNIQALDFLLAMNENFSCDAIVFLGDYVDRGSDSVSVLCRLLEWKMGIPENVILLRGNHESREMNLRYGFYRELDFDDELLSLAQAAFSEMPIAAVVNNDVFCVHGGIPGAINIGDISKENAFEFMWNDPSKVKGITPSDRGMGPKCFGNDVFSDFMQLNGLSLMVRGHSSIIEGYRWWFDNRLLSLFSAPGYCGYPNTGAFVLLKHGNVIIYQFGPDRSGQYSLKKARGRTDGSKMD